MAWTDFDSALNTSSRAKGLTTRSVVGLGFRSVLVRIQILALAVIAVVAPCYASKPMVRDGSTIEKAIPLRQRGAKAVEEEMAWMVKLYRYTPLLATRDVIAEAVRKIKAGNKRLDTISILGSTARSITERSGVATGLCKHHAVEK